MSWKRCCDITQDITVQVSNPNCVRFSGLLHLQRPQPPLSNGVVRVEEDSENEDEDDHGRRRDRDTIPGTHSSAEEHIFEYLPPQLHKGIERLDTVLVE